MTGRGSQPAIAAATRPVTPVGILAARLRGLVEDIEATADLAPGLVAELVELTELAGGLEPYTSSCSSPQSEALSTLAARTAAHDWGGPDSAVEQEMLSGHVEGRFLAMLVRLTGARSVLDIGMFTGYSALAMAEALPADGAVVACELEPAVASFAQTSFDSTEYGDKITVLVGPASDTLAELAERGATFDLVFLDADKAGYLDYFTTLLDRGLLAPGGLICADNTLLQGEPYRPGKASANGAAIAAFNESVAADPRVEQVLVPLRDGITLIRPITEESR